MGGAGRFGFSGLASWASTSPGLARWLVLLDPFRVGAWLIPRVRGCVFLPRACALGCPARPFQGRLHTVNGPQPGRPAKHMTIGMDRGRLLTVRPLRLIRRSLGTITRRIATVSRVGDSQRCAGQAKATPSRRGRLRHMHPHGLPYHHHLAPAAQDDGRAGARRFQPDHGGGQKKRPLPPVAGGEGAWGDIPSEPEAMYSIS